MSTVVVVFAFLGLAVGAVVLVVVLALLQRVLRPLRECKRYAEDTLAAGLGITRHLDGADELVQTRELATGVPGLAVAFLEQGARG